MDLPFGYTLSIWAAGQLATEQYGVPGITGIIVFVGGAITAYLVMAAASSFRPGQRRVTRAIDFAVVNVVALVTAVMVSAITFLAIAPPAGFFLTGFAATLTYTLLLTLLTYVQQ